MSKGVFTCNGVCMSENSMEAYYRKDCFYMSIDNPWAGCTETGFGATTSIDMTREDAIELRNLLDKFIKGEK